VSERRSLEGKISRSSEFVSDAIRELSSSLEYLMWYEHLIQANPGLVRLLMAQRGALETVAIELESVEVES
jgi:hypothetical protein